MSELLNIGQMLRINATKYSNNLCLQDATRRYTYSQTNARVNSLANSLTEMGLNKGDVISVLLDNCIEIVELYLATAKNGIIINPINFRLNIEDILYIAKDCKAKAFIFGEQFRESIGKIKNQLAIKNDRFFMVGSSSDEYLNYHELIKNRECSEPAAKINGNDIWVLLYTSGTTGKPKGVLRDHNSYTAFYLINAGDFGFKPWHTVLNIMPLCHVNATFFSLIFTYIGGSIYIHPATRFIAEEMLELISTQKPTFISLIPTHYALMLAVDETKKSEFDVSSVKKLLCSSAPARMEHKKEIMKWFKGVELYEGYGSTEAGIVTVLAPHEQLTKQNSIGRESTGTELIKLLDENGSAVKQGEIGELFSSGPMLFNEYLNLPEATKTSFNGKWFSAGDMAYQDEDGYYFLVDRKHNMIITGGEHVYPSVVENIVASIDKVIDVAIIGTPHEKWGEAVTAIVIPKEPDDNDILANEIISLCKRELPSYACPKNIHFITEREMPRTATGKILHRILKERYCKI